MQFKKSTVTYPKNYIYYIVLLSKIIYDIYLEYYRTATAKRWYKYAILGEKTELSQDF